MREDQMKVAYRVFSRIFLWKKAWDEAAAFASSVGRDRLVGLTQTKASVVVWYWTGSDA
jgi:hypothetical protein